MIQLMDRWMAALLKLLPQQAPGQRCSQLVYRRLLLLLPLCTHKGRKETATVMLGVARAVCTRMYVLFSDEAPLRRHAMQSQTQPQQLRHSAPCCPHCIPPCSGARPRCALAHQALPLLLPPSSLPPLQRCPESCAAPLPAPSRRSLPRMRWSAGGGGCEQGGWAGTSVGGQMGAGRVQTGGAGMHGGGRRNARWWAQACIKKVCKRRGCTDSGP